ncbi:MAG: glycerophosphodiester phosphodiesterase [Alphaproteobacteria bacterium]|nr:glycerophosphodiester phosphodiesterase [Alphaproteobacteria bacterium]
MIALPRVIGHRGCAGTAPENTLAGLRRARDLGCTWVEFDARIAADGTAVLMHDATVDRTTDGKGAVADKTAADLARLDAGSWFGHGFAGESPPSLEAVLAHCMALGLGADIEVKADRRGPGRDRRAAVAAVARAIAASGARDTMPILLSSFDVEVISWARRLLPQLPRMLAAGSPGGESLPTAQRLDCMAIACNAERARPDDVNRIRAAGLAVVTYTVNQAARATALYAIGVDAIVSDHPDRIGGAG